MKAVYTRGGLAYPSSNVSMRVARLPLIAVKSWGTQLWSQLSPVETEQECMLLQSFGVSQMKFVPALKALMTCGPVPGTRFAHREGLPVIVVYDRNGKWSSPRGGWIPHPLPEASSANAFQVWPEFSMMSTSVGWFRFGWFPSPLTPNVLPPM